MRRNPTSYKCSCGASPRKAAGKECCNRWRRQVRDTGHGEFCQCVRPNSKQKRRLNCRIHGRGIDKLRNPGSGVPGGVEAGNQQPWPLLQPVPPQLLPLHSMHAAPTAEQLATLYLRSDTLPGYANSVPFFLPASPGSSGHTAALSPYTPLAVQAVSSGHRHALPAHGPSLPWRHGGRLHAHAGEHAHAGAGAARAPAAAPTAPAHGAAAAPTAPAHDAAAPAGQGAAAVEEPARQQACQEQAEAQAEAEARVQAGQQVQEQEKVEGEHAQQEDVGEVVGDVVEALQQEVRSLAWLLRSPLAYVLFTYFLRTY